MSKHDNNLLNEAYNQIYNNIEEAKKAKKDYDGNGKVESPEEEYKGSRGNAIKKKSKKKVNEQVENLREATIALIEAVKCMGRNKKNKKYKRPDTTTGSGDGSGA